MLNRFRLPVRAFAWLSSLLIFGTLSCETDVEINAPREDVTVVYGLLDQNEAFHYVKINRAFQVESNALEAAQIRDSSEYDPSTVTALVQALDASGDVVVTYTLRDTVLSNKEEGTFFSPDQTLYYFVEPNLNPERSYRLDITIGQGENAKKVTAETPIINSFSFSSFILSPIPFSLYSGGQFQDEANVAWTRGTDAKRYELKAVYRYRDILTDGSETVHSVEWVLGTETVTNPTSGGSALDVEFNTEDFYRLLSNRVPAFQETPNLARRVPSPCITFRVDAAGDDLNTFIEVNEPATSIVQERPEFTNVTNGIGIWSCRFAIAVDKLLSDDSIEELVNSTEGYTETLNFCNPLLPNNNCGDGTCL
ncbi:MAG: hypothetical protein AAGB22_08305 [Bacteroidota bacterium]